ncbi:MAG: tRNA pseudouridine(55) synthase TruB [Acidimicrobiales bacterium]
MSRKTAGAGIDGVCVIDKPPGWTSHDVVAKARRQLGTSKVGHAGTLDPGATGVLVLGVGRATRLLRFLTELPKSYVGEVVFGSRTSTLDNEGEVIASFDMTGLTLDRARQVARGFVGEIEQVPPMVSALKVGGRRLHELAREGIEVERAARPVTVHRLEITALVSSDGPVMGIEVDCSSGTYVRTLADDLGRELGGGAYLRNLRRTAIGPFTLDRAQRLSGDPRDVIERDRSRREAPQREALVLLAPSSAVSHLPTVTVDEEVVALVATGRSLACSGESARFEGDGPWAVQRQTGELVGVYERIGDRAKPAVVLIQPEDLAVHEAKHG